MTKTVKLTSRQQELLVACIEAELENNWKCDTSLSCSEEEKAGVNDETNKAKRADKAIKAHEKLRKELVQLIKLMK